MLRIYGPQMEDKIRIVHTGVDQEKFWVPPKQGGAPQVLFVGALSEIKGVTCLIDAFTAAHSKVPEMRLVLVGSGPRAQEYKKYVQGLNLDGAVQFRGPVQGRRPAARALQELRHRGPAVERRRPDILHGAGGPELRKGGDIDRTCRAASLTCSRDGVGILMQPEDGAQLAAELEKARHRSRRISRPWRRTPGGPSRSATPSTP